MVEIRKRKLDLAIEDNIKRGNFIFGICLGMQLFGSSSNEDGFTKGLEIINNKIIKFSKERLTTKKFLTWDLIL